MEELSRSVGPEYESPEKNSYSGELDDFDKVSLSTLEKAEMGISELDAYEKILTRDAETRNNIARIFVSWYVFLIPFIFVVIIIFNLWIILGKPEMVEYLINIEDTLMVLQALLGTPLGFVVGYYFKSQES
jgi:uncharacterized membrane protein